MDSPLADEMPASQPRSTLKRVAVWSVNILLVLIIIGLIIATWMPAIYSSDWIRSDWFHRWFPRLALPK